MDGHNVLKQVELEEGCLDPVEVLAGGQGGGGLCWGGGGGGGEAVGEGAGARGRGGGGGGGPWPRRTIGRMAGQTWPRWSAKRHLEQHDRR